MKQQNKSFLCAVLAVACCSAWPLAAASGARGSKHIWSDCGRPGDHGKIDSITIVPDPPVAGQDVSITGNVTLDEEVTGGKIDLNVVYGGIPVYDNKLDLCEAVAEAGMACPLKKGLLSFKMVYPLPKSTPKGTYSGKGVLTDQNGSEVVCVKFQLTV